MAKFKVMVNIPHVVAVSDADSAQHAAEIALTHVNSRVQGHYGPGEEHADVISINSSLHPELRTFYVNKIMKPSVLFVEPNK